MSHGTTITGRFLNRLYQLAWIGKASGVPSVPERTVLAGRQVVSHLKHGRREEALAAALTDGITAEMLFESIREAGL